MKIVCECIKRKQISWCVRQFARTFGELVVKLMCRCVCCIHAIGFQIVQSNYSMYVVAIINDTQTIIPSLSIACNRLCHVCRALASHDCNIQSNNLMRCVYGTVIRPKYTHFTCGWETEQTGSLIKQPSFNIQYIFKLFLNETQKQIYLKSHIDRIWCRA